MENILKRQLNSTFVENKFKELRIEKGLINFFIDLAENNLSIFKNLLGHINSHKKYKYPTCNLVIDFNNDIVILNLDENSFNIFIKDLRILIISIIDLIEPIYPLGTVVNLKTEYLNNLIIGKEIGEATFVIINRFIYVDDVKTYFQYTGIPYPVGNLGISKNFYFTSELINEVLSLGYSDHKESAFIYMMKKELLIEKGYTSIAYAPKEEMKRLEDILREI